MNGQGNDVPPDVRTVLQHERDIPSLPAAVRARVITRARAALVTTPVRYAPRVRVQAPVRWAVAAAVTFAAAAAVGAAAYEVRAHLTTPERSHRAVAALATSPVLALAATPRAQAAEAAPAAPEAAPAEPEALVGAPSHLSRADAARAELHLLRTARAAVARQDFAAALPALSEHARRFKNGRMAEEREALRVRALAGLGRTDEARRAGAQFRARFPRSVLLPAVRQMSN